MHATTTTSSSNKLINIRAEQQEKVMLQLMRAWLNEYDHSAMLCPKVEPMLKRLVTLVRRLLDEFCTTFSPDDLLVVVFFYADKFIHRVGYVDKNHLTGILISSVIVTVKFHEDKGLYNSWVASSCNLTRKDTHHMERVFLSTLKYELMITSTQIRKFYSIHHKAWEDRCSMHVSPSSYPKAHSSSSSSSLATSSRTSSSASSKQHAPSSSSSKRPLVQNVPLSSTKSTSSSSSSSTKFTSSKSSHSTSSKSSHSTSSSLPSKPTTAKISKVTKSYKLLAMFKICVPL